MALSHHAPHFTRLRPLRACGLFILRGSLAQLFVPLDDIGTPSPFRTLTFAPHDPSDPKKIHIWQSCNGLLLCSTDLDIPTERMKYYVYNPSTNQLAILPKPPLPITITCPSLAYDPLKSPHYKVIAFSFRDQMIIQDYYTAEIHIYSSETATWRVSVLSFSLPFYFHLSRGVYWNKCLHWFSRVDMEYHPGSAVPDGLYFNVDGVRVEKFAWPPLIEKLTCGRNFYFGVSEDHLHFIEVSPYAASISVCEMKSDYSEWFVKYRIDLAPISKVFPEMTNREYCFYGKNNYAVGVLALIRREKLQEDSFLVLEIPGKAIRYNLVDGSFKVIREFAVDSCPVRVDPWPLSTFEISQYIETLSCV